MFSGKENRPLPSSTPSTSSERTLERVVQFIREAATRSARAPGSAFCYQSVPAMASTLNPLAISAMPGQQATSTQLQTWSLLTSPNRPPIMDDEIFTWPFPPDHLAMPILNREPVWSHSPGHVMCLSIRSGDGNNGALVAPGYPLVEDPAVLLNPAPGTTTGFAATDITPYVAFYTPIIVPHVLEIAEYNVVVRYVGHPPTPPHPPYELEEFMDYMDEDYAYAVAFKEKVDELFLVYGYRMERYATQLASLRYPRPLSPSLSSPSSPSPSLSGPSSPSGSLL